MVGRLPIFRGPALLPGHVGVARLGQELLRLQRAKYEALAGAQRTFVFAKFRLQAGNHISAPTVELAKTR